MPFFPGNWRKLVRRFCFQSSCNEIYLAEKACSYISHIIMVSSTNRLSQKFGNVRLKPIFHLPFYWQGKFKAGSLALKDILLSRFFSYPSVCRINNLNLYSKRHLDKSKLYQKSGSPKLSKNWQNIFVESGL